MARDNAGGMPRRCKAAVGFGGGSTRAVERLFKFRLSRCRNNRSPGHELDGVQQRNAGAVHRAAARADRMKGRL
jgi:hypothetical protein